MQRSPWRIRPKLQKLQRPPQAHRSLSPISTRPSSQGMGHVRNIRLHASQYITFRWEYKRRAANVRYFSGPGGVTPPGGNQGALGSLVPGWAPDLRKNENRLNMAILV